MKAIDQQSMQDGGEGKTDCPEAGLSGQSRGKRLGYRTARGVVAATLFIVLSISLVLHTATGTPSAFGVDSIAAICPVGALEVFAGAREVMVHPFLILVVTVALAAVLGKAFCAWGCPVPWVQRIFRPTKKEETLQEEALQEEALQEEGNASELSSSEKPTGRKRGFSLRSAPTTAASMSCGPAKSSCEGGCKRCKLDPVGGKRDGLRVDARHFALLGAVASSAVFGFPVFCLVCPVGLVFAFFIGLWHLLQFNETSWGLLIVLALLVIELLVFRKWCFSLCPISALTSLLSRSRPAVRPRVKQKECLRTQGIDCHVCVDACPERVDPHSVHIPECSRCGECIEHCPMAAIRMGAKPPRCKHSFEDTQ